MQTILDISCFHPFIYRTSPTGIESVEMAYTSRLLAKPAGECTFTAQSLWGHFVTVPHSRVAALLDALEEAWDIGATDSQGIRSAQRIALSMQSALTQRRPDRASAPPRY